MKTWSFYSNETGLISGFKITTSDDEAIKYNTPEGMTAIEGLLDELSQRVDVETGEVVDYQPPAPSSDHEWNIERKRWLLRADVAEARAKDAQARARIAELESKMMRALRENALGDKDAAKRLKDLDDEIAAQRKDLLPVV